MSTVGTEMSTVAIVRRSIIAVPAPTEHESRLEALLGIRRPMVWPKWLKAGFTLTVDTNIIRRFKYAASIHGRPCVIQGGDAILYRGDIPDFAIDRIAQIIDIHHSDVKVSIHSNLPLPIRLESAYVKIDPVVIAWIDHSITIHRRVFGGFKADRETLGVIVAMWDMDKEITL